MNSELDFYDRDITKYVREKYDIFREKRLKIFQLMIDVSKTF